uniref:Uncharacterized protein n=1 Tax=Kalanchoe fedtschenkoi TaxID=63787 RepID=A0A7N0SYC4_KALFE
MQSVEGVGDSAMAYTDIEIAAGPLDASVKFHVVKDILGFILYMHQQIPSVLQDLKFEFESLQTEYEDLELCAKQVEAKAVTRRMNVVKKREVKYGIKRLQKLMSTTSDVEAALQLILNEAPNIQSVLLILGASSMRPQHVYEMSFLQGCDFTPGVIGFAKSKAAEGLSRKAIRALISRGAGSSCYGGQSKLFLLVKAPSSLSLPLHFLPKRDFRYSKKIVPVRLQLKCKLGYQKAIEQKPASQPSHSLDASSQLIWYVATG